MANPEHVRLVRGGANAINKFKDQLDLEDAQLEGLDLTSADFSSSNLKNAHLSGSNLDGAKFRIADVRGAKMSFASLMNADFWGSHADGLDVHHSNLRKATFEGVSLCGANLRSAYLDGTRFVDVRLRGADLRGAQFVSTVLTRTDLTDVLGLDDCLYTGPSVIDIDTILRSGSLPPAFLRGLGLPQRFIDFLPSLLAKRAVEFYSCFISHSNKDIEFAERLHMDLQQKGVRCWFANEDLRIGDKFRPRIDEAIRLHDKLLLILSEDAVNSPWVEDEVESALEKERKAKERGEERTVLFPIRLDSAVEETDAAWAASIRRTRHIGDFSAWKDHDAYQVAFERLLRDLKSGGSEPGGD